MLHEKLLHCARTISHSAAYLSRTPCRAVLSNHVPSSPNSVLVTLLAQALGMRGTGAAAGLWAHSRNRNAICMQRVLRGCILQGVWLLQLLGPSKPPAGCTQSGPGRLAGSRTDISPCGRP